MKGNYHRLFVTVVASIFALAVLTVSPIAFAQNNQTGTIEDKIMQSVDSNSMRATAPGDNVFVLICPPNFKDANECQIFVGRPA